MLDYLNMECVYGIVGAKHLHIEIDYYISEFY
jgi:hypothetical protein